MREPVKFGDYYLFERVAVGGMAEVFKGVSYGVEGFERLFAVKRVLPNISEDAEFIEMFIDEAKIAVQLTHANIGQIFELGNAEGAYFIAMEFVQGKDLRAIFDRARQTGQRLDVAMCCHVVKEVCEALEYAHAKRNERQEPLGLIHRDVSPQNILVSYDGEVKLIDFGIAKAAGKASKTQAGILKGKFGYMSPEQVRGKVIDKRSDLFSLAVVLFELLTLERCFQGESDFSTLEKVRNVDIRRPSALNRDIPPELERIVLKGLARNPDERYQTAAELQDALQKFLYQSGAFYARKDLAGYMRRSFDRALRDEADRLSAFRSYAHANIPAARRASSAPNVLDEPETDPGDFKADLPALSWEEEEIATSVWDRAPDEAFPETSEMESPATIDDPPAFANAQRGGARPGPADLGAASGVAPVQPSPALARPMPARLDVGPAGGGPNSTHLMLPAEQMRAREVGGRVTTLLVILLLAVIGATAAVVLLKPRNETSTLTLRTQPTDVDVWIDGTRVYSGATPHDITGLEPGRHQVKVSAAGYQALESALDLGKKPVVASLELQPLARRTVLELETRPGGATLFVDNQRVDQTPLSTHLAAGEHSLRVEKDGYLPWEAKVVAKDGAKVDLGGPVRLYPATISMTFLPEPATAEVAIVNPDGRRMTVGTGSTSLDKVRNDGRMVVEATAKGYKTLRRVIPQTYDLRGSLLLQLEEDEKAPSRRARPRPARPRDPPVEREVAKVEPKRGGGDCEGEDCPPAGERRAPPPPPPEATGEGYLKLLAKPPAQAFVGGSGAGWTPLLKYPLPAGTHTVRLLRETEPAYDQTLTVVIEPGKTTFRKYVFE